MTTYAYDGETLEDIVTTNPTHKDYVECRIFYRGAELFKREIELVVYHESGDT